MNTKSFKSNLISDFSAGIVVFLVALPLCLGIALASGAPLISGIISGIIGGIVVGAISQSPTSVSGPAAGLTVIIFGGISTMGSYEAFLTSVFLAGIIQIFFGFVKGGLIGDFFPSAVIKAMLAAIGLILMIKQVPHIFGFSFVEEFSINQFFNSQFFTLENFQNLSSNLSIPALSLTVISLLILLTWELNFVKQSKLLKIIPPELLVVIVGIIINQYFFQSNHAFSLSLNQYVSLPIINSIDNLTAIIISPDFSAFTNYNTYVLAITLAIIASLETLLSVDAADKIDPYKRITPKNRELKAQGLGNILSSLVGGLPMTAVIVRSSANINAGGKTKLSAIFHGVILLVCVIAIPDLLNTIPLACLAAILVKVGYKLVQIKLFKEMYKAGWDRFLPFILTILAILVTDLLQGIIFGIMISIFFIIRNNFKTAYFIERKINADDEEIIVIELSEDVTFLNKASISQLFSELKPHTKVIIDAHRCQSIDYDSKELIIDFQVNAKFNNIDLELIDFGKFM